MSTSTNKLSEITVAPNPARSKAKRAAELLHAIEAARQGGWTWNTIAEALTAEGIECRTADAARMLYRRARRLVESGKVQPRPLPRVPAGGSSRPAAGPLSQPRPNRAPSGGGGASPFGDDTLIQEF